ncbi:MAG TPA: ABC transporter substrate-binding protein [Candidatus Avipropionibacterium avicola]|uniref:ABC transporter substrate-binding protein n=1 Tax=Candidatus Avipropionibacterium avicola TaxID=2840701 RepID=A0A9D1H0Q9_9ACTN|nr:ABC transporter substrate-binding protein [Candidatus Avipropionibacterium avicola]
MEPCINRRRLLQVGTATALAATLPGLAGCAGDPGGTAQDKIDSPDDNINPTGMPIVTEPITLSMMTRHNPSLIEDWNSLPSWAEMEKLSNVHVEWGMVPWESASERRNLALASGDYPGILHRTGVGTVDLAKYGEQGTFVALNSVIDEYMPNLSAILDEHPEYRSGLTFPDGNIYSLPTIYDPAFESLVAQYKLWVRQDWLDSFSMSPPETIEEFEAYLDRVVHDDPNGNGKADEIGYATSNATLFVDMLRGTFGVGNRGVTAGLIDADESGGVRFWPTSEQNRDLLDYIHRLYDRGLIQDDIFSSDSDRFIAMGQSELFGAVALQSPTGFFGADAGENYLSLPPLKKDSSDPVPPFHTVGSGLHDIGQFVITDKAEHPIEACRWMDHFYGDEGARLFFMGVEGESYRTTKDGRHELLPHITDNPDGLTVGAALRAYVTYAGGSYPGIVKQEYFQGSESSDQAVEGTEALAPYVIDEIWPSFTYTSEEAAEMSSLSVDIDKLATESRAKFITGELSLDDWDTHVGQFDQVGLDRYLEIQQAALDRYRG